MRIAALSDIHGDIDSLNYVWRRLELANLTENLVVNAGDNVAYGKYNSECIAFLQNPAHKLVNVGGNYDYNVANFPQKRQSYRAKWGSTRPEKYNAIAEASNHISTSDREWLFNLPKVCRLQINGIHIVISHYSPVGRKEGLHAFTLESRLHQIAERIDPPAQIIVTGHTHSAFQKLVNGVLFVNPGSIGRSDNNTSYAEISLIDGQLPSARIVRCDVSRQ